MVTKSGTNAWHGTGLMSWSGAALDAGPRQTLQLNPVDPARAEYVRYPEDPYTRLEPGLTVGGPLRRDRLWLFVGYIPSIQSLDRTVTFYSDGSRGTFTRRDDLFNATGTMTAKLPRGTLRAAISAVRETQLGALPAQDGTSNPAANYGINTIRPAASAAVSMGYALNGRTFLSLRAGTFSSNEYNQGVYQGDSFKYQTSSVGLEGVPAAYQQPRNYSNVALSATGAPTNSEVDHARERHPAAAADTTFYFEAGGEHALKGGFQFDRIGYSELSGFTGNIINVYWGQSLGGQQGLFGYYTLATTNVEPNRARIIKGDARTNNLGLFVQDSWRVGGRLALNLGIRTENEHVPSFSDDPAIPRTAMHFGFGSKLAPRVGAAWDARGDGRTKVFGSWGLFYDVTKLSLPLVYFGAFRDVQESYTLETGDLSTIVDNAACPPRCPGRFLGSFDNAPPANDPAHNLIDPDVRQMRTQEAIGGVEHEVRANLSLGARVIHKQLDRAIDDIGDYTDEGDPTYIIGNPGYTRAATFHPLGSTDTYAFPKARRTYDAFETTIDKRMSQRWSGRVSYTWSRLWGNYSGLNASDQDGMAGPNTSFNFDSPMMLYDGGGHPVTGVLATDRPHQFKANVVVNLPGRTSLGLHGFAATGLPRNRVALFGDGFPVMYLGRNSDGRLPVLRQIDLYVQHELALNAHWRLTVSGNVTNLLNTATATNYFAMELQKNQSIVVDESVFYKGVDTQQLIEDQSLQRDARFLMDSSYQAPRTIRLGISLSF